MSIQVSRKMPLALLGLVASYGLLGAREAWAGPARYDPESRSIRFTYTYAALADGRFGDAAIGAPQKPTNEQDATVRTVVLKVSDAISKATSGRLKIASLDLVPDVKRADVVISLTGKPGSAGWAMAGAIEGRPGQIGLYYQSLAAQLEQDHVLTAAHEVCHYVFGVVDEYNFPSGCPSSNLGGPGCLMDNYLSQGTRHGWYGRFCSNDHVSNPAQRQSCQEIVDRFFRERNVTTNGEANEAESAVNSATTVATRVVTNRKSKIDNITRATIGMLRELAQTKVKDKKGGAVLSAIGSLKSEADSFLKTQLQLNQVQLSSEEKKDILEGVLKQTASLVKVAIPPRFQPVAEVIGNFAQKRAKELRENSPQISESSRKKQIVDGLRAFISGFAGTAEAPTIDQKLTADEKAYLDHIAMQAATTTEEKKLNDDLYQAALKHIELDRETAGTVLDIAGELGVVGIENRLAALGEVDADLRPFIPGRTASTGFGRRRTIIIDPDPLDPRQDYVLTQSGLHRYTTLRDQYVDLFTKLVERAKVELLTTDQQKRRLDEKRKALELDPTVRSRQEQIREFVKLIDRDQVRVQREADFRASLNNLILEIRRNRLENIVFLVPPGGLPRDIGALFEGLRRQLIIQGDVRLDLVMVGPAVVPFELRDIAIGSGGSISTIADIDEVGAVAQRLKNDQGSGSWVILPHQDVIRGPRTDTEATSQRKAQRWLLNDKKIGTFPGSPIEYPYFDLQSRLVQLHDYFHVDPKSDHKDGQTESETRSHQDLRLAGLLPPAAIDSFCKIVNQAIGDPIHITQHEKPVSASEIASEVNLTKQLDTIVESIRAFNNRTPGSESGEVIKQLLVEQLIQTRTSYQNLNSLLEHVIEVHKKLLAQDYNEEQLFNDAYKRHANKENGTEKEKEQELSLNDPATDFSILFQHLQKMEQDKQAAHKKQASTAPKNVPTSTTDRSQNTPPNAMENNTNALLKQMNMQQIDIAAIATEDRTYKSIVSKLNQEYPDKVRKDMILAAIEKESKARKTLRQGGPVAIPPPGNKDMAPTLAYLALMQQQVRLQAVGDFLDHIERDLSDASDRPLSGRIDRRSLVLAMERLQDAAPDVLDKRTGRIKHHPLAPVDTITIEDGEERRKAGTFRLPRFYAENVLFDEKKQSQAEFELIIGFSRPLPGVDLTALRENRTEVLPELRLYNDNGQLVNTPTLRLDRDVSTQTCLVYHFKPEFKEEGWYTGALILKDPTYRALRSDTVNFTFSVASTRPNFRLNSALVQMPNDPELIPPPPIRGLSRVMDRRAKIEVQVYGGTSVLDAAIQGVLYKLGTGTEAINPIGQTFYDDGATGGDRMKGDGIYTSIIPFDVIETGMEYRLLIQAESTDNSRNIPPENPNVNDEKRREQAIAQGVKTVRATPVESAEASEPEPAVIFQRATSIQIRVER